MAFMTRHLTLSNKTEIFVGLLWAALVGLLLKDLYSLWNCSRTLVFHEDEYQHLHLAWNTLRGKIIYRDFEDSHGPLSTLLYAFFLRIKPGMIADVSSLYTLRSWNLVAVLLTAGFIALSVFHLTQKKLAAAIALLIYFSSPGIKSVAFRVRPDCYVALFSVLSLYCGLKRRPLWMGFCIGLALGFHAKFLPIASGILAIAFLLSMKKKLSFGRVLAGLAIVLGSIFLWSWSQRALSFLMDGVLGANFRGAYQRLFEERKMAQFFFSASRTERWFWVLVVIVLVLVLVRFLKNRKAPWTLDWILAGTYTVFGLLFLLAPVWAHALTFVIPTVLVFLAASMFHWTKLEFPLVALAVVFCGILSFTGLENSDHTKDLLPLQLQSLETTLKEVKRTEPIFYIWTSRCPAYVFNEDPSREWMNPFQRRPGQTIRMQPPINFLSIHPMFLGLLDAEERNYVKTHFRSDGCLWRRTTEIEQSEIKFPHAD